MINSGFLVVGVCLLAGMLLTGCGEKDRPEQSDVASGKPAQTEAGTGNKETKAGASVSTAVNIDAHPGKALHDSNCISCHDSAIYTRKDRKVSDFPMLLAQVKRCDANLRSRLPDEEIKQVADYLNQAYYQYDK